MEAERAAGATVVETTAHLHGARRAVAAEALGFLGPDRAADVELCVSELLTNALEHGWSPARLRSDRVGDSFVVTVVNRSDRLPQPATQAVPHELATGRGLQIVQRVADGLAIHTEHGDVVVTCRFDS